MSSSEFRVRYATLDRPVVVTALGRPIGTWTPVGMPVSTSTEAAPVKASVKPVEPAEYTDKRVDLYKAIARKPKA